MRDVEGGGGAAIGTPGAMGPNMLNINTGSLGNAETVVPASCAWRTRSEGFDGTG